MHKGEEEECATNWIVDECVSIHERIDVTCDMMVVKSRNVWEMSSRMLLTELRNNVILSHF